MLLEQLIPFFAIFMVFSTGFFAIWLGHRKEVMKLEIAATAEKTAQYAASNQELADRVAVLERIVTDRGYDVATQIEALRDARRVEAQLEAPEPKGKV